MARQPETRLRIAHVSDCFAPRLGGIEVQVGELARIQSGASHETHVITATPAHNDSAPEADDGIHVHRVTARLPFELPLHPRAGRELDRLLAELQPDVVHAHVGAVSPFAWSAVASAARAGLPTVVTVHSMWDPMTRGLYRSGDLASRWSRWPLVITAVSHAAASSVRRSVGGRVAVHVVPNGLDATAWRAAGLASGASESNGEVHVVAVGRLAPRKQPLPLLRLLRAARDRLDEDVVLRATIVGDGPAEPAMRRFLRRHGMTEWVQLPGRLHRDQLPALLASADIFLAPAEREAFGLAALEARTVGAPIVARQGTGVADFVRSEREGLLGGDSGELVDAIVRLAADRDLRERIAAHNRTTVHSASAWPAVLGTLDRCYALAGASAARRRPAGGLRAAEPHARSPR